MLKYPDQYGNSFLVPYIEDKGGEEESVAQVNSYLMLWSCFINLLSSCYVLLCANAIFLFAFEAQFVFNT